MEKIQQWHIFEKLYNLLNEKAVRTHVSTQLIYWKKKNNCHSCLRFHNTMRNWRVRCQAGYCSCQSHNWHTNTRYIFAVFTYDCQSKLHSFGKNEWHKYIKMGIYVHMYMQAVIYKQTSMTIYLCVWMNSKSCDSHHP